MNEPVSIESLSGTPTPSQGQITPAGQPNATPPKSYRFLNICIASAAVVIIGLAIFLGYKRLILDDTGQVGIATTTQKVTVNRSLPNWEIDNYILGVKVRFGGMIEVGQMNRNIPVYEGLIMERDGARVYGESFGSYQDRFISGCTPFIKHGELQVSPDGKYLVLYCLPYGEAERGGNPTAEELDKYTTKYIKEVENKGFGPGMMMVYNMENGFYSGYNGEVPGPAFFGWAKDEPHSILSITDDTSVIRKVLPNTEETDPKYVYRVK